METAKAVPNTTPNTKFTKGIFGLQNDFGDDFGDRKNVDPPMSDEYVAHFGSVDAELSGPRMFGPPMSDEYVAPLGQSKRGPGVLVRAHFFGGSLCTQRPVERPAHSAHPASISTSTSR